MFIMLRTALLATLLASAITPVLTAKEKILVHRIGPSDSTLFIAKTEGSDEHPLLANSGLDYSASFSADGKWIIFTSERAGSADIYRVHPDGSGLERLTDDPAYEDQASLSPDGKSLAFVSSRGTGSTNIWVLDLQTKKARNLTHAPGSFRPSWSPDGKWIAFSSDRNTPVRRDRERFEQSQAAAIYVMRADGTSVRRVTSADKFAGSPKWSPDGQRIVFYEMEIQDTFYARVPGLGKPADSQIVSVGLANGIRQEHTSGPGLKVSPRENRIRDEDRPTNRAGIHDRKSWCGRRAAQPVLVSGWQKGGISEMVIGIMASKPTLAQYRSGIRTGLFRPLPRVFARRKETCRDS